MFQFWQPSKSGHDQKSCQWSQVNLWHEEMDKGDNKK